MAVCVFREHESAIYVRVLSVLCDGRTAALWAHSIDFKNANMLQLLQLRVATVGYENEKKLIIRKNTHHLKLRSLCTLGANAKRSFVLRSCIICTHTRDGTRCIEIGARLFLLSFFSICSALSQSPGNEHTHAHTHSYTYSQQRRRRRQRRRRHVWIPGIW